MQRTQLLLLVRRTISRATLALVAASGVACGGGATGVLPAAAGGGAAHPVVEVAPVVVSPHSDAELADQFERGRSLLFRGELLPAAELFERLARIAPASAVAAPSLLNAGVAREGLGDTATALARYEDALLRHPEDANAKLAELRIARLLARAERWSELGARAERVLGRKDLTTVDLIEAHGLHALARVEQDDVEGGGRSAAIAVDLIEQHRLGEAGRPPIELAPASFALGEVRRKKSEKVTFSPMPPNFVEVLEQRCQGLLDAQGAYTEAMRSMDAHWSAMAGYRVGQLYQDLHRDVMELKAPAAADTPEKKQLFEAAMRLRYRVLLEKGLKMMDATTRLGERTGEESAWVGRARAAKGQLERALAEEKAALAKMPFTEKEVQAGLDSLRVKKP